MKYYGNNNSEWGLSTSAKIHTTYGGYFPIDYMYGDNRCLYFHCTEYVDSAFCDSLVFYHPELWVQWIIHDSVASEYTDKRIFEKKVGCGIVDKMVPPDEYYKLFLDDENALPWIPDSLKNIQK